MSHRPITTLALALVLAATASAQTVVFDFDSPVPPLNGNHYYGVHTANAGDVNGDGVDDIITSNPFITGSFVDVYSGSDGSLLHHVSDEGAFFGWAVAAAGDVNGDGLADFAVTAPQGSQGPGGPRGNIKVFSGADATMLLYIEGQNEGDQLGYALDMLPDMTGDGLPEFLVGVAYNDDFGPDKGKVMALKNSAPSELLFEVTGPGTQPTVGRHVAVIGDANLDGVDDFAVGVPGSGPGYVVVYSGLDGSVLVFQQGTLDDGNYGLSVSAVGDVDGDGRADVLVGSRVLNLWPLTPGGPLGLAQVISGADGSVIIEFNASHWNETWFGTSVAGVGDITGDGVPDVAIAVPMGDLLGPSSGYVRVLSGADGSVITTLAPVSEIAGFFGHNIEAIGDIDQDGFTDLAVGSRHAGVMRVISLADVWRDAGGGVVGSAGGLGVATSGVPILTGEGSLLPNAPFSLKAGRFQEFAPLVLVLGFSQINMPFKGGVLVPNPQILMGGLLASEAGGWQLDSVWPGDAPSGIAVWTQLWAHDNGAAHGLSATNGLRFVAP